MSKSVGNTLVPQKLTSTLGADVVRLWIAATDYANEMSVSDEILRRMADSYRRMRNTLRFLLSNMHGFDPVMHAVPWSDLVAIDRWAIRKAFTLQNDVVTAFRNYEFHDIYQKVHNFCVVELGAFYLDILKDRLYTTGSDSLPRRSAQTGMYHVADAMVRWLAPILSFTAEEAWSFLPGERNESVFLNTWHEFPAGAERASDNRLAGVHRAQGRCGARAGTTAIVGRDRRAARGGGVGVRHRLPGAALRGIARRIALFADHQPSARHRSRDAARVRRAKPRRRRVDRGQTEFPAEMRALLEFAQRRRERSAAPGTLRALRRQHRRARRGAQVRMSVVENRGRAAIWLLLSAVVVLADQLTKSYITQHFGEFEFTQGAAGSGHYPHAQCGRRIQLPGIGVGLAAVVVHRTGGGREHRDHRLAVSAAARHPWVARGRAWHWCSAARSAT